MKYEIFSILQYKVENKINFKKTVKKAKDERKSFLSQNDFELRKLLKKFLKFPVVDVNETVFPLDL